MANGTSGVLRPTLIIAAAVTGSAIVIIAAYKAADAYITANTPPEAQIALYSKGGGLLLEPWHYTSQAACMADANGFLKDAERGDRELVRAECFGKNSLIKGVAVRDATSNRIINYADRAAYFTPPEP